MKKIVLFFALITAFCILASMNYKKENDIKTYDSFEELLKYFPKGNLPFHLTTKILQEQALTFTNDYYCNNLVVKKNILPKEFRKYFPSLEDSYKNRLSRMPPAAGEPLISFDAEDKHILVYFIWRGGYTYQVATFDNKGNLINEKVFAVASLSQIVEVNLDKKLNLNYTFYTVNWDKKPNVDGYKDCKITSLNLIKKTVDPLVKKDSQKEGTLGKDVVQRANP
jgi:hypothetical protein